jgi:hypothetical protein
MLVAVNIFKFGAVYNSLGIAYTVSCGVYFLPFVKALVSQG